MMGCVYTACVCMVGVSMVSVCTVGVCARWECARWDVCSWCVGVCMHSGRGVHSEVCVHGVGMCTGCVCTVVCAQWVCVHGRGVCVHGGAGAAEGT